MQSKWQSVSIKSKPEFNEASPGDKLIGEAFRIEFFKPNAKPELIYTYSYAPEEAWLSFSGTTDCEHTYTFTEKTYFRVIPLAGKTEFLKSNSLKIALLSDIHYAIAGNWEQAFGSIAVNALRGAFDIIVNLGDNTDGLLPKAISKKYNKRIVDDLKSTGKPLFNVIGNHDYNYFSGNPEPFSADEIRGIFELTDGLNYSVNFEEYGLTLIFIESFDPSKRPHAYGYNEDCLDFLEKTLHGCGEKSALIFSHLTPMTKLQAWNDTVRNEDRIMDILRKYSPKIMAYINGHQHCDHVYFDEIPIITECCLKCECFPEHKIPGGFTPKRSFYDNSSFAYDILTVNPEFLHFERFGAGKNRLIKIGDNNVY
jgi:predicted phosphodiesterase